MIAVILKFKSKFSGLGLFHTNILHITMLYKGSLCRKKNVMFREFLRTIIHYYDSFIA